MTNIIFMKDGTVVISQSHEPGWPRIVLTEAQWTVMRQLTKGDTPEMMKAREGHTYTIAPDGYVR